MFTKGFHVDLNKNKENKLMYHHNKTSQEGSSGQELTVMFKRLLRSFGEEIQIFQNIQIFST